MTTLGVDVAQGGADDTVLARCTAPGSRRRCGGAASTRQRPGGRRLVIEQMRDGAQVNIDLTGGWGGSARDHLAGAGHRVEPVVFSQRLARAHQDGQLTFSTGARAVVEVPRGARPGAGRRHRAAARPRLAAQLAGADLDAARQRDR
jgi:hypothetical protein